MAIFGLVSKTEHDKLIQELEALKTSAARYERWMLETADAEKFNLPDPSVYENQADSYRISSWVALAVDLAASAVALPKFSVERILKNEEAQDIPSHPFELLLSRPNDKDSRFELLYATIAQIKLTGNCYWWMNAASEFAPPDEMWILPSHMVIPLPDERDFLRGYMYYPGNGREIFLEPHEVVHFKRYNPFSMFIGLSVIESLVYAIRGDLAMQEWQTNYYGKNNARLPGVMTFDQMIADPTWEKIKQDTREASRKRELLMLRGVGEGGVKWLQNASSQRDMEYLAGREYNKEEIMSLIAKGSYAMLSDNATQANAVVARASFYELEIYPLLIALGEKISNHILPRYGDNLHGLFEDVRMADEDLKMRRQEAFERSHTIEEVRREFYGDDPIGDERDNLLPAQVRISAGGQPALNKVNQAQPDKTMEQPTPETRPEAVKMGEDLERWKRKALKKIGRAVPFESEYIPSDIHDKIQALLPACKSEADIRQLFASIDTSQAEIALAAIKQALRFRRNG
jgi:HK97 family phage portal protein